jgi:Lon protease-like protein
MSQARIPLFPLGSVLLPGARLPLQLFEPRYLALAEALARAPEPERCFGVLWIRQGHEVGVGAATSLAEVGCEAQVEAMARDHSTGRRVMHLVATGRRRFHLDRIDQAAGTPYLTGEITWLTESAEAADSSLVQSARDELAAYQQAMGAQPRDVEAARGQLAYRIADQMVLEAADRQCVLSAVDEEARLIQVRAILRRETALLRRFHALPRLDPPDGAALN